jgi:hypothetical protein
VLITIVLAVHFQRLHMFLSVPTYDLDFQRYMSWYFIVFSA